LIPRGNLAVDKFSEGKRTMATHPYLSGNYAPVNDEVTLTEIEVQGRLPELLTGLYLRIGPNPFGPPPDPYHWFVGDGMVHSIALARGRAL
jgi:carotenoid cleavage oxygenase